VKQIVLLEPGVWEERDAPRKRLWSGSIELECVAVISMHLRENIPLTVFREFSAMS
jgi:hypothetical protein